MASKNAALSCSERMAQEGVRVVTHAPASPLRQCTTPHAAAPYIGMRPALPGHRLHRWRQRRIMAALARPCTAPALQDLQQWKTS
ncbi:hypothetical protein [Xanthomonas campestris]|uniref:hypothetical protein n=1 Tax=Xanthomonas campestris TaxID=339 RepID=UPI0011159533|nr:hypothetical protein [Xanthomonas campestris]WVL59999.1 hypothetical protein LLE68_017235 [Xanthomonas campestris pv. barbareae]